MTIELLKRFGWFVAFVLAQVIVLGRIHLFGVATPFLYVYFILQLPRNYPKWAGLLWAFFMGLSVDIFLNTPGFAATSLTLIAAIQPYYMELFVSRDSAEDMKPAMSTMGATRYTYFVVPLVLLFCLLFFTIEHFSFFNFSHWLSCVFGSAALTLVLIFAFEIAKNKQ